MSVPDHSVSSSAGLSVASLHGLLTGRQAALQAGITYRMLDYYTHRGLIVPAVEAKGSGSARLWYPEVVGQIADLRSRIEACPFHPHRVKR